MPAQLTEQDVRNVAKLSRLVLSEAEVREYSQQLSQVLAYVDKLKQLNVEGVEPMAHALDLSNVLREDQPQPGLPVEKVLANAPAQDPPFFKVPKVIGEGSGA